MDTLETSKNFSQPFSQQLCRPKSSTFNPAIDYAYFPFIETSLFFCLLLIGISSCQKQETPLAQDVEKDVQLELTRDAGTRIKEHLYARPLSQVSSGPIEGDQTPKFRRLENCGVDFENFMYRSRGKLIDTGSGVALADYDGDGLIDIYLTGSDIANKLYRNVGNLEFEDVTDTAGVNGRIKDAIVWSSGASFADIDNDGDLDLYLCNMASPNLLYVNQGDGTFKEETYRRGVSYFGASKQANFCDYDRDGDLDFYLVTYQDTAKVAGDLFEVVDGEKRVLPGKEEYATIIDGREEYKTGERDLLFLNDGTGNFEEVAQSAGISGYDAGLSSVWFDFNDDSYQDLYVTSDFKQPDHLYLNQHDGTFIDVLPDTVSRTPWFSMGLDAGDLDKDGRLDLLVADMADRTHYGQKLNMGDMDDAGWFLKFGNPRQFMTNCLYLNTGTSRFLEFARQAGLAKSDWTWSVRFADLDLDTNLDVFFTNGHSRDAMNGDLAMQHKALDRIKDKQLALEKKTEFNRKIPPRNETNLTYANRGNLKFESVGKEWGLDFHGVSHSAGFADLDLDGDLDCVINNYYTPSIVYENTTNSGGRLLIELRSAVGNTFGVGSKVELWQGDNYQRRDLLPGRGYLTSDPMMLHFGIPQGKKIDRLKVTWPDGRVQQFADLDPDHIYRVIDSPDATVPAQAEPTEPLFVDRTDQRGFDFVHRESDFDDFAREPLLPFQLSRLGGSITCGDINRDGWVDVYCGGAAGQSGKLLINRGGTFDAVDGPWAEDSACEDMGAIIFDADGDGNMDLYVSSGGNEFEADDPRYRDRLYRNLGDTHFENATDVAIPNIFASSSSVCCIDFDRDGDLDLFAGSRSVPGKYPLTPKSYLLLNDNGIFTVANEQQSGGIENVGLVNSAIWSDYDADGWPDLLIAVEWGPIAVFKNDHGELVDVTESAGTSEQWGWWHGISAADLDADGDMDYVVTNQGRNTKYHATPDRPHRLYYDDFDKNGTLDLVEAEFEGDVEYPVRGRSCSARCMPFIADKYKTFHDYSLASISDIYQVKQTPRPVKELRVVDSVVLWNENESGFRIQRLPDLAQISPGYGVSVSDFDGDGILDILMATNFFASQPETGYMDGGIGWLLKGSSNGTFLPVSADKSGVVVPGDANGLAIADVDNDGDQDALCALNNARFHLLENQASTRFVSVEVDGIPNNPTGVGTRFVLLSDELQSDDPQSNRPPSQQAFEISSGGSYLSQSSALVSVSLAALKTSHRIIVYWPDGTESTFDDLDGEKGRLILKYPQKRKR